MNPVLRSLCVLFSLLLFCGCNLQEPDLEIEENQSDYSDVENFSDTDVPGDGDGDAGDQDGDVDPGDGDDDSDPADGDGDGDDDRECFTNTPVAVYGTALAGADCQTDNPPANAIDGDPGTRSACEGVGSTLTFDLGSSRPLCSVAIAWHHGDQRTNDFQIQTSDDGTTFADYGGALSSEQNLELQGVEFQNREARFVRIVFLGNSTPDNDWMSVTQVEITTEEEEIVDPVDPGACDPDVLIINETFEGSQAWSGVHQQFGTSYAFTVVDDPVFAGDHAGRFELRYGDPVTSNGIRSEVLFPPQDHHERWYAFATYYPSAGFAPDSNNDILSQWHQGSGSGSPTSTMRARDDRFFMRIGSSGQNPDNREWYDIGPQTKDVWHHFVFRVIHSGGSDGLFQVWHNGELVLDHQGGNMDPDFPQPRWKVGIYKSAWHNRTTDADLRILYVDNVRIGDENATLEDMINCP